MENKGKAFKQYAPFYDLIYQYKDYAAEASFVSSLIKEYGPKRKVIKLLDLACGTGRHAQELAVMGYSVEGSDISADMVKVAQDRVKRLGLPVHFYNESFQSSHRISRKYDAVIAMFSAIDYLTSYKDLKKALKNIRGLLKEDGVFVFDFWNGNAVLKDYSPVRIKKVVKSRRGVTRTSKTTLDVIAQIATVNFDFVLMEGGNIVHKFSEVHPIRYYFPQEMMDLLEANGFKVVHRCPFMKKDSDIKADEWNLTYVAQAR